MKCKKCGFEGIEEKGDWITCPSCGAKYFNTNINAEPSATMKIDEIEKKADGKAPSAEQAQPAKTENKQKSKFREATEFFIPIVLAVILALLLKNFVFANAVVPTGSMISTINEGDRIIASRIAYIKEGPQRYDIILFYFPDDESQIFVKRVIGLPGDTVEIKNGVAYITDSDGNTEQTDQSFVKNETPVGNYGPFYVPQKDEIITTDGAYCYAENGFIVGSADFLNVYCKTDENGNYVVSENCYFCIGDNRNHSHDSRFWNNTYVAENKILGEAKFKYYPKFEKFE